MPWAPHFDPTTGRIVHTTRHRSRAISLVTAWVASVMFLLIPGIYLVGLAVAGTFGAGGLRAMAAAAGSLLLMVFALLSWLYIRLGRRLRSHA